MIMMSKFFFNFSNFCDIVCFLTKLLTLGILFSSAVNAVFVAQVPVFGILFSTSLIFAFLTRLLTPGNFFSNSVLSV